MQTRSLIAVCIAVVAALFIMLAGKSCTESIAKNNKKNSKPAIYLTSADDQSRPAATPPPVSPTAPAPEETTLPYETVTNLIGEVIETIPVTTAEDTRTIYVVATDEFGNIIATVPYNDPSAPTTTLSLLEQYEATLASMQAAEQAEAQSRSTMPPTTIDVNKEYTIHMVLD